jgi:hypothetical protein
LGGIGTKHSNFSKGKKKGGGEGTYKNHWYARLQSRYLVSGKKNIPRYYIYQYLGIYFFLPETSACDINKANYFI